MKRLFNSEEASRTGFICKSPLLFFLISFFSCQRNLDLALKAFVIDVGHGDAILLKTPDDFKVNNGTYDGLNILVDGGSKKYAHSILLPFLKRVGVKTLDYLIITHNHEDHIGGAVSLLEEIKIKNLITSGLESSSPFYLEFKRKVEQNNIKELKLKEGESLFWGKEIKVKILNLHSPEEDENNSSIVLKISYGEVDLLLTGDIEGKNRAEPASVLRFTEKFLVDTYQNGLRSEILKVAHHGSETSTTDSFLRLVAPKIALITAGRKKFGKTILPDTTVVLRIIKKGIKLFRTDYGDTEERSAAGDDHILIRILPHGQIECRYSNL